MKRMTKPNLTISFLWAAWLVIVSAGSGAAQSTAFTYQGRLTDAGVPPTGTYDIRFQLYDALTGGNVICGAQGSPNVSVVNGAFTVQLDFGSEACFPFGSNRYLEVAVRPTGSPNPHMILAPRQQILSVPFSMKSLKAQDANNATNAQLATNALSLGGIGASLYLRTNGDGSALTNLNAGSITSGTLGDARLSSNIARLDAANQTFTGNTFFGGNVGLGTASPQSPLSVQTGNLSYGFTHSNGDVTVGSYVDASAGWFGTRSNHPLKFFTNNGLAAMTIETNGKVSIGGSSQGDQRLYVISSRLVGITGESTWFDGGIGVYGTATQGLSRTGVWGNVTSGVGVRGSSETGSGIYGESTSGYAGYFDGVVKVRSLVSNGINHLCYLADTFPNYGTLATCSSSLRYKKDLESFTDGLSFINQLRPISFRWKSNDERDIGFGAEDLAKINPLFVTYNKNGQVEGVKYDRLSAVFVNAFKEQQQQINAQRILLEQQQTLIKKQQRQLEALTKIICQTQPQAALCQEGKD